MGVNKPMTNVGAVSSWVAAGVSVATFGAGTLRAWWNRPQVDWTLEGKLGSSDLRGRHGSPWMKGTGTFTNFGDGPAHRVSVHIHRGGTAKTEMLGSASLLRPGERIQFEFGVSADQWDETYLWVTWTRPPIRRHREATSARLPVAEHIELNESAKRDMAAWREERAEMEALAADFIEGEQER
jgi:hypothetical protein